jgi:nitrite reductase/ring-hydroxylating ferredoxin subunit
VSAELRLPLGAAPAAGERRMLELGGHRIGLYRVGEELHALADRCPHRGAPLCSSGRIATAIELRDGVPALGAPGALVRCPWHKWDYDIASGRCAVDARLRVRRYAVRVEGDEVVVSLRHPARGQDRPNAPASRSAASRSAS